MNKFSERFRELRCSCGYSREQVANELKISVRLISYWESGQRECNFDMLIKVSDLFKVSTDYLLGRKDY